MDQMGALPLGPVAEIQAAVLSPEPSAMEGLYALVQKQWTGVEHSLAAH
jgi:hypothetical protein